jgi:DNA-binding CsgD family transcriptional regulator
MSGPEKSSASFKKTIKYASFGDVADHSEKRDMMEVLEKLLAASSKAKIMSALAERCRELGFEHFIYTPLMAAGRAEKVFKDESRIFDTEALIAQNTLFTYPDSWAYRYQQAQHVKNDPIIEHLSGSILPIFWDDADRAHPKNIVLGEAKEHGLGHGITVSLFGHGGQRAVLSFARDKASGGLPAPRATTAALVQLTATYVHEVLWKLGDNENNRVLATLSVREMDCLQWAAVGKTSWEIAQILKISERTAIFHMTNAARKLGATNRRQAVVRALALRLINP